MITMKHAVLAVFLLSLCTGIAAAGNDTFTSANALYSKSIDLANEGKYQDALEAADEALALNVTAINHVIQANRAGILVMLGRYDEAVTAADAALAVRGNLTATYAAAYYNKGDALRYLGRTEEAREAFQKAYALDSSMVPPSGFMSAPTPTPTKSPSAPILVIAGVAAAVLVIGAANKP